MAQRVSYIRLEQEELLSMLLGPPKTNQNSQDDKLLVSITKVRQKRKERPKKRNPARFTKSESAPPRPDTHTVRFYHFAYYRIHPLFRWRQQNRILAQPNKRQLTDVMILHKALANWSQNEMDLHKERANDTIHGWRIWSSFSLALIPCLILLHHRTDTPAKAQCMQESCKTIAETPAHAHLLPIVLCLWSRGLALSIRPCAKLWLKPYSKCNNFVSCALKHISIGVLNQHWLSTT